MEADAKPCFQASDGLSDGRWRNTGDAGRRHVAVSLGGMNEGSKAAETIHGYIIEDILSFM